MFLHGRPGGTRPYHGHPAYRPHRLADREPRDAARPGFEPVRVSDSGRRAAYRAKPGVRITVAAVLDDGGQLFPRYAVEARLPGRGTTVATRA